MSVSRVNAMILFGAWLACSSCLTSSQNDLRQKSLNRLHHDLTSVSNANSLEQVRSLALAGVADQLAVDIEEDPNDRFITSSSGELRSKIRDDDDWANDVPISRPSKTLIRKKRCGGGGGGGGGDGDGNANRARRIRRNRARAVRRARARANKRTTVTTRVIQNGQVVSETVEKRGNSNSNPAVQSVQPGTVVVPQGSVPVTAPIVQATPQQVNVSPQHIGLPNISVQGSIQIGQPASG